MRKKRLLKRAFTLTELLVVVIVLGVLASVAVPKFSRVLETRRTTEAESILTSLRTEQEHRCVLGKEYQILPERVEALASAKNSKNYSYSLTTTGAKATSTKGYAIQMPSYQNGQLCCEGKYCDNLNKNYPPCSSISVPKDECAAPCEDCTCPEYSQNNPCECNASYEASHPCECSPYSCACWDYADSNPCECSPDSCACPDYAAEHTCECANECTCEEDPAQEKCQTCANPIYAAAHACECDASYAAANPCECSPNSCACSSYAEDNPCECSDTPCDCPSYATAHPCECSNDPCDCPSKRNTCACQAYEADHLCECDASYAASHPKICGGASNKGTWTSQGFTTIYSGGCSSQAEAQAQEACDRRGNSAPSGSCSPIGTIRYGSCEVNDYCPGGGIKAELEFFECK